MGDVARRPHRIVAHFLGFGTGVTMLEGQLSFGPVTPRLPKQCLCCPLPPHSKELAASVVSKIAPIKAKYDHVVCFASASQ